MLFRFKMRAEDFVVEEILWFVPDGKLEFLYILFEKREKNTMDVLDFLMKSFGLKREQIGIAGLKDKMWITRQRLCIGLQTLEKVWGQELFLRKLQSQVKILEQTHHSQLLKVGQHSGNRFVIRMRAQGGVSDQLKKSIGKQLSFINHNGFANFFGIQRFGKGIRNYKRAVSVFESGDYDPKDHMLRFQLQAWVSMQYNRFLKSRLDAGQQYLPGDILIHGESPYTSQFAVFQWEYIEPFDYVKSKKNYEGKDFFYPESFSEKIVWSKEIAKKRIPTWPLVGNNILLPPNGSPAFEAEWEFLKRNKFFVHGINICKHVGIWWVRRPLWVFPQEVSHSFEGNDMILNFALPTWAYATVLLAGLFQELAPETYAAHFQIPL